MDELIKGVEKPKEGIISYDEAVKVFERKGLSQTSLNIIKEILDERDILDLSGYSGNSTIIVPSTREKQGYCIKISDQINKLKKEKELLQMFSNNNLSPEVISYIRDNIDVLITKQIDGNEVLKEMKNTADLAKFMGKALRNFHDSSRNFVITEQQKEILDSNGKKIINESLKHEKGLEFIADYQNDHNYTKMKEYIKNHINDYKSDVIIHGDFNPRNVFAEDGKFTGFIDITDSSFGDRHYDIFWTMWTVSLYLGIQQNQEETKKCEEIFLESYGTEKIDQKRLTLCKKINCMYWQENNEIKYFK